MKPKTLEDLVLLHAIQEAKCPKCGCTEVSVVPEQSDHGRLTQCADCGHLLDEAPTRAQREAEYQDTLEEERGHNHGA